MYIHTYTGDDHDAYVAAYRDDPTALLRIDQEESARLRDVIIAFYRSHLSDAEMDGYVVGLSGGVDSATTATLLADAVGPDKVHAVIMPAPHTDDATVADALSVADDLGISTNDPDRFQDRIADAVDALESLGEQSDEQQLKRGNILARCRMTVLRDVAKARTALVAGTTNASERDLGYMTLAADGRGGIDNEALYDLYKTSERDLARHLDVPDRVITREPTADLWPGQTDAAELGHPYGVLDQVLVGLRLGMSDADIADAAGDITVEDVHGIRRRKENTAYKREGAPHPSLS
ncbi:MAG: NAD(+) synthase [Candidatus Nanohaloarchaea archaeon]